MRTSFLVLGAGLGVLASAAFAESAKITAVFPAKNPRIAMFKSLGIDNFSGREGSKLAFELERYLTKPVDGNSAYFSLLADGSAPDGIVRGDASSAVTETPYQQTNMVCVTKDANGKCLTKAPQVVNCMRRIVEFTGTISVVDNASGEVIFTERFPRRNDMNWCGNQQPWATIDQTVRNMATDVAKEFRKIATPRADDYSVRYKEKNDGLDSAAKASFKTAMSLTKSDPMAACRIFDELSASYANQLSVVFNQGVCDEIQHNYVLGEIHYTDAAKLEGGRGDAAKALERVQQLKASQELSVKRG